MPLFLRLVKGSLLLTGLLLAGRTIAQDAAKPPLRQTAPAVGTKRSYDEAARSWYSVYYALDTLYISIAVTDPVQQKKLVMNGLQVWIDPRGKKNKKTGIEFPFNKEIRRGESQFPEDSPPALPSGAAFDAGGSQLPALEKQLALQHEMRLTGFREELNGVQNNFHPSGIRVFFSFLKDTLFCQAQLPINIFTESPGVHSRWSVGLVEKGNALDFQGSGLVPPGGPDGMPPPPGLPPGEEEGMRIFEDNTIWYRLPFYNADPAEKAVAAGTGGK